MKAVAITTDGVRTVVEFEPGKSYEPIKTAVEGWIECVHLPKYGCDMWVNEEGKIIGLPYNPLGSMLWAEHYGVTDAIVGNIIITGGVDREGETLGLSDEQVAYFLAFGSTEPSIEVIG